MSIFDRPLLSRKAIAYNAGIAKSNYLELVDDTSVQVLCVLARNPIAILFKEVYGKLMVHTDEDVRVAVASNFAIPAEAAIHLSTDKSDRVLLELAKNSDIPEEAMLNLADDYSSDEWTGEYYVLIALARNEAITVRVMEKMSENINFCGGDAVMIALANHVAINDKIALNLLGSWSSYEIEDILAGNPNVSDFIRLKIGRN